MNEILVFVMIQLIYILSLFSITSCNVLLQSASGEVNRGSFIYWSLNYNGNIRIKLISLSGDADLYISERIPKPDYEPDKYDLHAASCGIDTVHVPSSFKRPVGIGIYGHPSYENSTYLLEIYYNDYAEEEYTDLEETVVEQTQNINQKANDAKTPFKVSRSVVMSTFGAIIEIMEVLLS